MPAHDDTPPRDDAPVPTGVAAAALGVAHSTLARWWKEGKLRPALVTPGGHARWNIDDLREQLRELRRSGDDGEGPREQGSHASDSES